MKRMLSVVVCCLASGVLFADEVAEEKLQKELEAATKKAAAETYEFRYKLHPKEVVTWKVTHLATTETKVQGVTQTSQSRSVSIKSWKVVSVDEKGLTTFENSVPSVDMWQKVSGRPEVRYNSVTDKTPPPEYATVAKTVGVTLATITIDPQGKLVTREGKAQPFNMGLGDIAIPLPAGRVKIGHEWTNPSEVAVRQPKGEIQRIKTRQLFRLEKVETGVATISIQTQVLTPVDDPKVRSQLMQQLTKGTIKFDLDAGRVMFRQMDWDEQVIGFAGANSNMQYLARFTEELQKERVAKLEKPSTDVPVGPQPPPETPAKPETP